MRTFVVLLFAALAACGAARPEAVSNTAPAAPAPPPAPEVSAEDQILAFLDRAVHDLDAAPTCAQKAVAWDRLAREAHRLAPVYRAIVAVRERDLAFQQRIPFGPFQGLIIMPMCQGPAKAAFDRFSTALVEVTGI